MNERIKQLAQIAQKYIDDNKYEYDIVAYHYEFAFREKFAELIVRECINMVQPSSEHREFPYHYLGGLEGLELLENIVEAMKKKFGIE